MALIFTPYRSYGLRNSFRTRYRIIDGHAEILKLRFSGWVAIQRIPLVEISTKVEGATSQKVLGRGNIKITAVSGETMLLEDLRNTDEVQDALYNWKALDVVEAERERLNNLTDGDLVDFALYYPHIPKTVDRLLRARQPTKYFDGAFVYLVQKNEVVAQGDVIATYGDFKLTAPFPGRVEFLGNPTPGVYDWQGLAQPPSNELEGEIPDSKDLPQAGMGWIVFSEHVNSLDPYAFALRPLRDGKIYGRFGNYLFARVRYAFDNGNVWIPGGKEYSLYSVIDMAVLNFRHPGSGLPLPESLKTDPHFPQQLIPYWDFINNATATIRPAT